MKDEVYSTLTARNRELLGRVLNKKFGRLTPRALDHRSETGHIYVRCECECGTKDVALRPQAFLSGNTQSCGCYRRERTSELKSGLASKFPREYSVFCGMKARCLNQSHSHYPIYGGRGITICRKWLDRDDGFLRFLLDMGPRPSPELSIDRVDNDGPYAPWNCAWATDTEQARNRSNNRLLRLGKEKYCLNEWAERLEVDRTVIKQRLTRGWSVEKTLCTKVNEPRSTTHWITLGDTKLSISGWERKLGFKPSTIKQRLKCGWTEEEALMVPIGQKPERLAGRSKEIASIAGKARMAGMTKRERSKFGKAAVAAREEKKTLAVSDVDLRSSL